MIDNGEYAAMRTFIDWTFHAYYADILSRWALSREIPFLRERTVVVCFKDMMDDTKDVPAINGMLDFWFNGTTHKRWRYRKGPASGYNGTHATSHDPKTRERLISIIQKLDDEVFGGEIAWLDSVFPC